MTTKPFDLSLLYKLSETGSFDRALDLIFEYFNDAFDDDRFDDVDDVLENVDIEQLGSHEMFGLLTASYPARKHLKTRTGLIRHIKQRLETLGKSRDEIELLLRGLL